MPDSGDAKRLLVVEAGLGNVAYDDYQSCEALRTIYRERLYRCRYATFEGYVRDRFEMEPEEAMARIKSAEVVANPKTAVQLNLIAAIRKIAPGVKFAATGMELPEDMSYESWLRVGQLLSALPGINEDVSCDVDEVIKRGLAMAVAD
jgi:hypothetical protein